MIAGVTGATGFLGRYIVNHLLAEGHTCVCWYRPESDRGGFFGPAERLQWIPGSLGDQDAAERLVGACEVLVHCAIEWPERPAWRARYAGESLLSFVRTNIEGTLRLVEAARSAGVSRFVYMSGACVYGGHLSARAPGEEMYTVDETHPYRPTWPYAAHKVALDNFIFTLGRGRWAYYPDDRTGRFPICSLRPLNLYGQARPLRRSKYYDLVRKVAAGEDVAVNGAVATTTHGADVAKAVRVLLEAPSRDIAGRAFNCGDICVSELEVAEIAKEISGSSATITSSDAPGFRVDSRRLEALGMRFGGRELLRQTIEELLSAPEPAG